MRHIPEMLLWLLVFNLLLSGGSVRVKGEGNPSIPHLLQRYFDQDVPAASRGVGGPFSESSGNAVDTIGRKGIY